MTQEQSPREIPYTLQFDTTLDEFSPQEKRLFELLCNAALDMAPIYALQENNAYPGANFYPKDATREEIEQAAKESPEIFSEYTLVKRDEKGKLIAVPYHTEYEPFLKNPAEKLQQAAALATDKELGEYLFLRAESLVDGNYEKSERVWLALSQEPVLDIVIGPYDRYIDQLFSKKYAYQAWTGIVDHQKTHDAQGFVNSILEEYGWRGAPIKARVDKTRLFSGLAVAAGPWSANNLPCQKEWREKYGSKITIFEPSFRKNVLNRTPILHQIWPESKEKTQDDIEKISRIFLFAHESFHPLIRREDDENRLKAHYSTVSELYCDLEGIRTVRKLVGKEVSEDEWRMLFPNLMAIGTARFRQSKGPSASSPYLTGESIALNYLMDHGSLLVQNTKIKIPSDDRLIDGLSEIIDKLEYFMSSGTELEADQFIKDWGKVESFGLLGQ